MEWALEPKTVSIQGPLGPRRYKSWTVSSLWPQAATASAPQPRSGGGGGWGGKAVPAAGLEVPTKYLLQVPQLSVESPFPPQAMEKLSSTKPIPGAQNLTPRLQ